LDELVSFFGLNSREWEEEQVVVFLLFFCSDGSFEVGFELGNRVFGDFDSLCCAGANGDELGAVF
jgi:hypothetical protein